VAARAGATLEISALRAYLKTKMPEYMAPSVLVFLEELPHHPNGKLNLNALPTPDFTPSPLQFAAPRTRVEEQVAQIWTELLKVKLVGIHDNFFDLGGHSLLATQVVSRLRSMHDGELTLREFFSAPTVAGLGALLENGSKAKSVVPEIVPLSRNAKSAPNVDGAVAIKVQDNAAHPNPVLPSHSAYE
jgi:hypothetical protein